MRLLRLGRNYALLFWAMTISNLGDGVSSIAYAWLASAITRDPVEIALIAMAGSIPRLILQLPAGVITDRVDRRKLLVGTNTFQFVLTLAVAALVFAVEDRLADPDLVAAGLADTGDLRWMLWVFAGGSFLFSAAEILRDNTAHTVIPAVVAPENLDTANGRLFSAETAMNSFVGPPVGGLLLTLGFAIPLLIDAGTFAVAAGLFLLMSGRFRVERPEGARDQSWREDIAEGVRWLWRHRLLRNVAAILGVMNMMGALAFATFVFFAQEVLGVGPTGFGLLATGPAVGGILGGMATPAVSRRLGTGGALYLSMLGSAVAYTLQGTTSSPAVVWAAGAIFMTMAVIWNVITMRLRQALVPDHLLGRVMSVYRLLGLGMMPIGAALGGVVVGVLEPTLGRTTALRAPFLLAAAVYLLLFVLAAPQLTSARIAAAEAEMAAEGGRGV